MKRPDPSTAAGLLLDTHVVLRYVAGDPRLPTAVRRRITDPRGQRLLFSHVSIWEMVIKSAKGSLRLDRPVRQWVDDFVLPLPAVMLPINAEHLYRVGELPAHHADPFDRLLVAQSVVEGCALLTDDAQLRRYDVPILWK